MNDINKISSYLRKRIKNPAFYFYFIALIFEFKHCATVIRLYSLTKSRKKTRQSNTTPSKTL